MARTSTARVAGELVYAMPLRMFEPVSPSVSFPELETRWLQYWKAHNVFEKSIERNHGKPEFVFYEGPPTANGMPHPGHVLTRVIKDVFLRYRTMTGFHVPRRGGWDTHGLPVEVEVEKALGIHGRQEIERYGVEAFTRQCIDSVFRYIEEWRRMTQRIGFWVDLDAAYVTFHQSYVESIWWALAEFYKKGLLYQDYKVVWWWPQGGTALSAGEVGQGYRMVDDPSIVVRFALKDAERTSFLAWTTTPWTLPSNVALAVDAKTPYVTVELEDGERLILAEARVGAVLKDKAHRVVETRKGSELAGLSYTPLFAYKAPENGRAYEVVTADFVTLDTGTGIVHVAPAFGEDDFRVAKEKKLGFLQLVEPNGTFCKEVTDFAGRFCKEADRDIIRLLKKRDVLFSEEVYRHEYPFCWRADQDPLIQYARRSWFVRTTQEIQTMLSNNQAIHWEPEHIKEGRFGEFLRSNVDWALSRERFWGTPLPIWVNDQTGAKDVVASVQDMLARNPRAFDAFDAAKQKDPTLSEHLRVHKPWVDEITWQKPGEPGVYRRVPDVIDCWFDSGCMPFAQWGYPHQNADKFGQAFPADFITEAVDQTRGWFYSLLAISSLLFPDQTKPHPYKNCFVIGLISDEKGQKLSKSKKNYEDPMLMIEKLGADAVRWSLYVSCVPGQNTRFFSGAAVEAVREFLLKLWNVYSFFVTYARIDEWSPTQNRPALAERSDLDHWILAELEATASEVRDALENYRSHLAARKLQDFVDALSNWYVRRCRGRFWAGGDSTDKHAAFATLYEVLVDLAHWLAPFTPFVAEALYQNLVRSHHAAAPLSIHLCDLPQAQGAHINETLRTQMNAARTMVTLGQRVRATAKIKVRQPLGTAFIAVANSETKDSLSKFEKAIEEELNVKNVEWITSAENLGENQPHFGLRLQDYVDFTVLPNFRALGPKLGKDMPALKAALGKASGQALYEELQRDQHVNILVGDRNYTLERDEVEVRLQARENFAAAAEGGQVVILDTRITDALRCEGLAREVVNRIQKARKDLDLPYQARIHVLYHAEAELQQALSEHTAYIMAETLALSLKPQDNPALAQANNTDIEGLPFTFWVQSITI